MCSQTKRLDQTQIIDSITNFICEPLSISFLVTMHGWPLVSHINQLAPEIIGVIKAGCDAISNIDWSCIKVYNYISSNISLCINLDSGYHPILFYKVFLFLFFLNKLDIVCAWNIDGGSTFLPRASVGLLWNEDKNIFLLFVRGKNIGF